jgi:hypothetical protein
MTRKDSEKESERPHYYSQFWLDVAAGRRIIGAPKPNEEADIESEAEPEPVALHRPDDFAEPELDELDADNELDEAELPLADVDEAEIPDVDFAAPEIEEEEEELFDEEEEEEDEDSGWTAGRGRKKPKPGRQVKPPKKAPKREPRRGF